MALIEEEGGGAAAGRSPRPGLSKWDPVPKSKPRDIAGTRGYRPPPPVGPVPGSKFDPSRMQPLTPYTMPAPKPVPVPLEKQDELDVDREGSATDVLHDFARQAGGLSTDPAKIAKQATAKPVEVKRRTYQLTWDEYNKLSDDQRAAVDFNTLLVQAREKDLANQEKYKPTPEQEQAYQEEVERMFGVGRGSETYAPETLGVLKQIDYASDGEDLDDFLGLKTAIGIKDLKDFDLGVPDPVQTSLAETVSAVTNLTGTDRAAYGTQVRLDAAIAKAGDVLQSLKASAARNRNPYVLEFGGIFNEVPTAAGYGARPKDEDLNDDGILDKGNINSFFQDQYAALTFKEGDESFEIAKLYDVLNPGEMQKFLAYADERSSAAAKHGLPLGEGKGYRTPEEFRKLLGLDRGDD